MKYYTRNQLKVGDWVKLPSWEDFWEVGKIDEKYVYLTDNKSFFSYAQNEWIKKQSASNILNRIEIW